MKDIDKAFVRNTQFEKIRFVRNIRIPLRSGEYSNFNADGDCNAAIALIDKGEMNCCGGPLGQPGLFEEPAEEEEHAPTPEEIAEEERRKAQEEEERLQREAEERAAAEAAEAQRRKEESERKRKERKAVFTKGMKRISSFFSGLVNEKDD